MRQTVFLVLDQDGHKRTTKNRPGLRATEVAVKLTIEVGDKFFERSIPEAKLSVPDNLVMVPEITVEAQ